MGQRNPRRCALLFGKAYLGAAPSLINAIRVLSDEGFEVDVISPGSDGWASAPDFPETVRLITVALGAKPRNVLQRLSQLIKYCHSSSGVGKTNPYCALIGADLEGLLAADIVSRRQRIPFLYWSLELRDTAHLTVVGRLMRWFEIRANGHAILSISQDELRASALVAGNRLDPRTVAVVPNGPLGQANPASRSYWQDRFDLDANTKVVLHLGMIHEGALSVEVARAAHSWPSDYILIFHERERKDPGDPYLRQVRAAGGDRVLFSLEPVPYDQLDNLVASADVGLVAYRAAFGPNWALMGGASGKLGHYTRCGIPVIALDSPGLSLVIEEHRCGVVVEEPSDLGTALVDVYLDYESYALGARRCYESVYEFGGPFRERVLPVIRQICSGGPDT